MVLVVVACLSLRLRLRRGLGLGGRQRQRERLRLCLSPQCPWCPSVPANGFRLESSWVPLGVLVVSSVAPFLGKSLPLALGRYLRQQGRYLHQQRAGTFTFELPVRAYDYRVEWTRELFEPMMTE